MFTTMRLLVAVALALWEPRLTTAQECTPEDGTTYSITSISQARTLFSDCDTIIADEVSIDDWDDTDDGTFSLTRITNITGTLVANYDAAKTNISRLEMPDLQYLGGFQMNSRPFDSIWFEELRGVTGRINVTAPGSEAFAGASPQAIFPKLKDAGAVFVDAGWVLINFLSLETVKGDLILHGAPSVPLPALRSAGFIQIQGTPSFIHLSNLQTAGPPRGPASLSTGSGMDINQGDSGISLEIPTLAHVVGDLVVRGTVIGLGLHSLETVTGTLSLSVWSSVDLPLLRSAAEIELEGRIDEASFPNLDLDSTTLHISSLPCSALGAGLTDSTYYTEHCDPYKQSLSTGAKAAVGIVVPLAVLGIFLAILVCHKRRVRRGEKAVGEVLGDLEMVDLSVARGSGRGDGGESGDSGDIERGRIPVTQPGRMERERSPTPPPPYEPRRG